MPTPPYNASGNYVLLEPFASSQGFNANTVYTCDSIDGFESLDIKGIDVFATYYNPYGIDNATYLADRTNSVNIVTLLDANLTPIYVPSSYIKSFPKAIAVPYNTLYAVFTLGTLPDSLDVASALALAKTTLDENIGCTSTYELTMLPNTNQVTFAEHQQLEANRKANINFSLSLAKQLQAEKDKNLLLETKIAALEEVIVATRTN